jgi:hypothetical protein
MVIQASVVVAAHVQPVAVVTATGVPVPPAGVIVWLAGAIDAAHDPASVTVNVTPAIVAVPIRVLPVLAATVIETWPLPDPAGVPVMDIQGTLLTAVHEHAGSLRTVAAAGPPVAPTACAVTSSEYVQGAGAGAGAASCVT